MAENDCAQLCPTAWIAQVEKGGPELLAAYAERWEQLCREGGCTLPSARPHYFSSYVESFEPGHTIVLVTVMDGERLLALLPLVEVRERMYGIPLRVLTSPRGEHYPWFDAIYRQELDPEMLSQAMLEALRDLPGWDLVRLMRIQDRGLASNFVQLSQRFALRGYRVECSPVPYIQLNGWPGDWDWFLTRCSSKMRGEIRNKRRKALELGSLEFEAHSTAEQSVLDEFYRIEASGWKGQAGTAILSNPQIKKFYDAVAQAAAAQGYFRLYLLKLAGKAIAAIYGCNVNGVSWFIKSGYDEQYEKITPSGLCWLGALRALAEEGATECDLLGSWSAWKARWTSDARTCFVAYLFHKSLAARCTRTLHFTIRPALRKVYRRFRPLPSPSANRKEQ